MTPHDDTDQPRKTPSPHCWTCPYSTTKPSPTSSGQTPTRTTSTPSRSSPTTASASAKSRSTASPPTSTATPPRHRTTWVVSVAYDYDGPDDCDLTVIANEEGARRHHAQRIASRLSDGCPDPNEEATD